MPLTSEPILWVTLLTHGRWGLAGMAIKKKPLQTSLRAAGFAIQEVDRIGDLRGQGLQVIEVVKVPEDFCKPRQAPTLWIAHDEDAELFALRHASSMDDVCVLPSTQVAAARLHRMLERVPPRDIDQLTGLLNRRSFGQIVRQACEEQLPGDYRALVLVDLDHFKRINDQQGHGVGDEILMQVSTELRRACGADDHLCRLGSDEFAVLMQRYDATTLFRDAERLVEHLNAMTFSEPLPDIALSASAGLARLRPGSTEPQLLRQADTAMYEAKNQGRGRLVHFELINDGNGDESEGHLRRFDEVTRMFSDRMTRMVTDMGRQLLEASRIEALQDPLTGARNRGFFKERLPREIERAGRGDRPLAMALLDLDNFHDINVTYGWPSGDRVLQQFVEIATQQLRMTDWLARYGGEEFAVVLPDASVESAMHVLERVRQAVQEATFTALDERRIPVTISVGVAGLRHEMTDAVSLADAASSACLRAKTMGKNQVVGDTSPRPHP